jgi:hypothetical protein
MALYIQRLAQGRGHGKANRQQAAGENAARGSRSVDRAIETLPAGGRR